MCTLQITTIAALKTREVQADKCPMPYALCPIPKRTSLNREGL
ncbi:MAG: hypothetical protein WBL95_00160 [Microcoleus sp.]